jgi:hypothetical protein
VLDNDHLSQTVHKRSRRSDFDTVGVPPGNYRETAEVPQPSEGIGDNITKTSD